MSEGNAQSAICDYLAYRKHFFWRQNTVGVYDAKNKTFRKMPKYAMKGVPDIIVIDNTGHAIFLEVKSAKGVLSKEQKIFRDKCKEKGAEYYLIRSVDELKPIGL